MVLQAVTKFNKHSVGFNVILYSIQLQLLYS